jgi:Adaptor complexes medium subunit family
MLLWFSLPLCSTATNVEIEVPVPADSTNPNIRTSMGSAAYAPENDALVWKIKSFPGGKVLLSFLFLFFFLGQRM